VCRFLRVHDQNPSLILQPAARVLRYVKSAIGETDVPDSLPEFIGQRRRWLNGSFFAASYSIAHTGQILRSGHSVGRKLVLLIETVYNIISLVFSWFSVVSSELVCERARDLHERLPGKFLPVFCTSAYDPGGPNRVELSVIDYLDDISGKSLRRVQCYQIRQLDFPGARIWLFLTGT